MTIVDHSVDTEDALSTMILFGPRQLYEIPAADWLDLPLVLRESSQRLNKRRTKTLVLSPIIGADSTSCLLFGQDHSSTTHPLLQEICLTHGASHRYLYLENFSFE